MSQELIDIWQLTESDRFLPYYNHLLKLLMVFGCRTQEARLSNWSEWDLENWIWTVPREHSKSDTRILRPVPLLLRSLILSLHQQFKETGLLLGEIKGSASVSQWGRVCWQKLGHEQPWGLHDFRRSLATKMNDMGIAPHVVEQLLGHTLPGVMAIYNRSQYLPEKLVALNLWCEKLTLMAEPQDNVVVLR